MNGEMGKMVDHDQREQLQKALLRIRNQASHFDRTQTIALFTILSEFDQRTKSEHGLPSRVSVGLLLN
jgi:hypothetical protein